MGIYHIKEFEKVPEVWSEEDKDLKQCWKGRQDRCYRVLYIFEDLSLNSVFHMKLLCNVLRSAFLNDGSGNNVDSGLAFETEVHSGDV